jgi:hypothetical protein
MRSRLIAAGFALLTVVLTLSSCNHDGSGPASDSTSSPPGSSATTSTSPVGSSGPCPGNVGGVCASPVTASPTEVSGP